VTDSSCLEGQLVGELFNAYIGGIIAGALELISGKPFRGIETKCVAKGDDYCQFEYQRTE
jgi:predicted hydrocarbon binding protein